jgi:hypothetical protein
MKRHHRLEPARQYRVIAQQLIDLAREAVPDAAASSVSEARQALVVAAELVEEAAWEPTCRVEEDKNLSD